MKHDNTPSDTPRVNEFIFKDHVAWDGMWSDFARQLERELTEARKDSARLDWLEGRGEPVTFEDAPHAVSWHVLGEIGQTNLRDAIDAAMKGTQ